MQPNSEARGPDIPHAILSNPLSNEAEASKFVDDLGLIRTSKGIHDERVLDRLKSLKTDKKNPLPCLLLQKEVLIRVSTLDPKTHPIADPNQIDNLRFYLRLADVLDMNKTDKVKAYLDDVSSTLPKTPKKGLLSRRRFGVLAATAVTAGALGRLYLANKALAPDQNDPTPKLKTIAKEIIVEPKPTFAPPTPIRIPTKTPEVTKTPEPTRIPEVQFNAIARLIGTKPPTLFDAQTGKPLDSELVKNITESSQLGIIGYGNKDENNFRCYDRLTKTTFDIPIKSLDVLSGSPVKDTPPLSYFGIRNNDKNIMPFVKELGASAVRIAANNSTPIDDPQLLKVLEAAQSQNLDILYVYNPSSRPPIDQIKTHMKFLLGQFKKVAIEIGNEPDVVTQDYWSDYNKTNGSLESFAVYIKDVIDVVTTIKPDTKLVIGALANPERNQARLVQLLKSLNIDFSKVKFAVHAYAADELEKRVKVVQNATGQKNLEVTELGHDDEDAQMLPSLIKTARKLGMGNVFIHELPQNEAKWGLINPATHRRSPKYFYLQKMVVDENSESRRLHSQM